MSQLPQCAEQPSRVQHREEMPRLILCTLTTSSCTELWLGRGAAILTSPWECDWGLFYLFVVGAIGAVLFSGLVIKIWRRHLKCIHFHTVPFQMFVRQCRNCQSFADIGIWHRCRRPLAFTRNSKLGALSELHAKYLMGSLTKGVFSSFILLWIFYLFVVWTQGRLTIITSTHICGTQGTLITICCLQFRRTPLSVGPYFLWFVFWAKTRQFVSHLITLCSPLQSLTTISLWLLVQPKPLASFVS